MFVIDVDNLKIPAYGLCIILSYVIGYAYACYRMKKDGVPNETCFYTILLTSILSMYLAFVYTYVVSKNLGLSSMGAMAGMVVGIVTMCFIAKDYRKSISMHFVTILPLMYAISKLGCLFAGCCVGIPYDGPFSIVYKGSRDYLCQEPTFPIQFVETLLFFAIFVVAILMTKKTYGIAITAILCCVTKFALDYLRASHIGKFLSINQVACIVVFLLFIIVSIFTKVSKKHL